MRTVTFLIDFGFWLVIRKESRHSEREQGSALTANTPSVRNWSVSKMFNRNTPRINEVSQGRV